MRDMMNDEVTIVHKDAKKHENIPAAVTPEEIYINDVTVPISVGDKIQRRLPSGQEEVFIVTKVNLWRGGPGIGDWYQIKYEREGDQRLHPQPTAVTVNVSDSTQTRINLNSTDQSTNTINPQAEEIFLIYVNGSASL